MQGSRENTQTIIPDELALGEATLPPPHAQVLPGICWGRYDCLFTPAYWAAQSWYHRRELHAAPIKIGSSLLEEVAACLLGGHGTPSEIGLAAFRAVKASGLLDAPSTAASAFETVLYRPLAIAGRLVRYRFYRRRARYLAAACHAIQRHSFEWGSHIAFRDSLTQIDGIGMKTASWITRNWFDSDQVAVLDVHVLRAGKIMGIFPMDANVARDYHSLERQFVSLATAISVRTSRLDALIWRQMKSAGSLAVRAESVALQQTPRSHRQQYT